MAKPSDLIPELQGRLPIRVQLDDLNNNDFKRILREPKNALVKQYHMLLGADGVELRFKEDALDEIADIAAALNEKMENIGARRLHTVMEKLLEDVLFEAPDPHLRVVEFDAMKVREKLEPTLRSESSSQTL